HSAPNRRPHLDLRQFQAWSLSTLHFIVRFRGNSFSADAYARVVGKVAATRGHLAARPQRTLKSLREHKAMGRAIITMRVDVVPGLPNPRTLRTQRAYAKNIDDIVLADLGFHPMQQKQGDPVRLRRGCNPSAAVTDEVSLDRPACSPARRAKRCVQGAEPL
ncbi:MAG: hypothetical protein ACHQZQ_08000, partial [SAR324 cluster bacterium]